MTRMAARSGQTRWQRAWRSLLYGRNIDHGVKAKARLGLAIVAFAAIYAVIAGRLVVFALASNGYGAHRMVTQDAVATARPDILDRTGAILATDVKTPSLFAEPRKLIDVDEAEEQLTAELPDLDVKELRERLASKRGFVWLKREITPQQQREIHRLGIPGVGFLTENKRVYPNGPVVSHVIGWSTSTTRALPAWRSGSTGKDSPRCTWPGLPPTACSGRSSSRSIWACNMRCAMSW